MIFYFTGTGNSRYVAERIASITGNETVSINDKLKHHDSGKIECKGQTIFVVPTYAWRIPKVVEKWITDTEFNEADKVWFVMTCGDEIGNSEKYNKILCEKKKFTYMGTAQIIMPENYIAMFNAPEWEDAEKIIAKSEDDITRLGELIKAGKEFPSPRNNLYDRFMSRIVNPVFYGMFVKSKAFYAKDSCIGCGECERRCPLNNIKMKNGKPSWKNDCTHCMACICYCPKEAIEYGKKSEGKPRYQCRSVI